MIIMGVPVMMGVEDMSMVTIIGMPPTMIITTIMVAPGTSMRQRALARPSPSASP